MDGTEVRTCECGGSTAVRETRMRNDRLMRRRVCDDCGSQFWTVEVKATRQYHELDFIEREKDKLRKRLSEMRETLNAILGPA